MRAEKENEMPSCSKYTSENYKKAMSCTQKMSGYKIQCDMFDYTDVLHFNSHIRLHVARPFRFNIQYTVLNYLPNLSSKTIDFIYLSDSFLQTHTL